MVRPRGVPAGAVVVTGATSGVGRAIVRRFAGPDVSLGLLARSETALQEVAEEVRGQGGKAHAVVTDIADYSQVERAAREVEDSLGEIGVWVNNSMTTVFSAFMEMDPEEYARVTQVTYLGTVWGTRVALVGMLERDRGVVIQVGSALAYRGIPLQSAYCGGKHGIKGFTESVRTELLHRRSNVHLGMVQLPAVNTPQFSHCRSRFDRHPMPVPPIYQPEVAAEAVHLAVRDRRREIYLGAPTWKTIAGNKLASGFLDRYLADHGVNSQLSDLPPSPHNRVGNLFEPVPGDPGAHGIFESNSRRFSPLLWLTEHRTQVGAAAALAGALGASLLARR